MVANSEAVPQSVGMAGMYSMNDLFNLVAQEGGEEMLLEPNQPPVMLLQGRRRSMDKALVTSDNVAELFRSIATAEQQRELDQCGNAQFSFLAPNSARFNIRAELRGDTISLSIKNLGLR